MTCRAIAGCRRHRRNRIESEVEAALSDMERAEAASKFEIYCGQDGMFRWRLVAANGQLVVDSAQGFRDRSERLEAIDYLRVESRALAVVQAT